MLPKTDSAPLYQMRQWNADDYDLLSSWWRVHGQSVVPVAMLPPETGWIMERNGEPIAAMFSLCAVGVGVAVMEWIVSRPGLTVHESVDAFARLFEGAKIVLAALDYGVVIARAPRAIARHAKSFGMEICSKENVNMLGVTR